MKLESKFRVTYSMLLNLLRVEQLSVEDVLQRSFAESGSLRSGMQRKEDLKTIETKLTDFKLPQCNTCTEGGIAQYYEHCRHYQRYGMVSKNRADLSVETISD